MLNNNEYVINSFEENFDRCKNKKIVLYGKGPFTKLILDIEKDYNIVGIMDRDVKSGFIYDKPVLSYQELIEQKIDLIIVISRPNSIGAVFTRLHSFCSINHIQLYGINGENLFKRFHAEPSGDEAVIHVFEKNFNTCKNKKMVLYGKGPRTRMIVEAFPDYNIIGLMDKNEKDGIYYGKRILSYEDVREQQADLIVAVTRERSTPYVYRRINRFCSENQIMLYDVEGENLFEKFGEADSCIEPDPYFEVSEDKLRCEIERHEVISFDIFDTLIMRKTLFPADVFAIVGERAGKEGIYIENFVNLRKKAERENVVNHANVYDIYKALQSLCNITDNERERLIELEIETEKSVLIRREKMVELFEYAVSLGKKVCIVSDMYLPEKVLRDILSGLKISGYEKFYVSCDNCISKGSGIFEIVKRQVSGSSYLHIGDNKVADGLCAQNSGYDTFIIKKAIDMLDISSYAQLRTITRSNNERGILGLFIAKVFNNPFALYHSEGRPEVSESYEYGYLFIAPLVTKFMVWLTKEIKRKKYDDILFSARDGYLILQLYQMMVKKLDMTGMPQGIYFPTSRLLNASISRMTEDDIRYSAGQPRSYTPEEMLRRKFKLKESDIMPYDESIYGDVVEYALLHKEKIFKQSEATRKDYFKYLERFNLKPDGRYGLFDFVSSGTSQYDMSRVVPFDIEGLYMCFYDIGESNRRKLKARAMHYDNYPEDNNYTSYIKKSYFFENYVFLEAIISSEETSVEGVDSKGQLIYGLEQRSEAELGFMLEAQRAIKEFFNEFITDLYIDDSEISMDMVDECYRYRDLKYTNEHCKELDEFFVFEDLGYGRLYFNRK